MIFGRFKRKNPRAVGSNRRILDRNVVVFQGHQDMYRLRLWSNFQINKDLWMPTHTIPAAASYHTSLREAYKILQTSPTALQTPCAHQFLFGPTDTIALPSVFLFQPQMLGVLDPAQSTWLRDPIHQNFSALVQGYGFVTRPGVLPYFSPARFIHFYIYFTYCIVFLLKVGRLVLPHARTSL